MKTLALIPARGGSKGIPRKNIRQLAGKPLIAWSIEAALACPQIDVVVVSTEDEEIAAISREWGALTPFMRPAELAQDDSPSMNAVLHALDQLPEFETVLVLQPTSPLRSTADIADCLAFAAQRAARSVVSVCEAASSPYWMYTCDEQQRLKSLLNENQITRRQDLPRVYALNGAMYFAHVDWLRASQTFLNHETLGYVMPPEHSLDIDTLLDWKLAELLLSESL